MAEKVFIAAWTRDKCVPVVQDLLRENGYEPVFISTRANRGRLILEKFEELASQCSFAIVIYTPADWGYSGYAPGGNKNRKRRARQNIVFEHGYLLGKLGREKVITLRTSPRTPLDMPSDLDGLLTINLEKDWELSLINELRQGR